MDLLDSSQPASTSDSNITACEKQNAQDLVVKKRCSHKLTQPAKSKQLKGRLEGKENGNGCFPGWTPVRYELHLLKGRFAEQAKLSKRVFLAVLPS